MKREFDFYRFLAVSTCALSGTVMAFAYAAIVSHTGNPWPWREIVHESGDRTLIGTIFFFEHAARELPLDVILGVVIGGSALFVFAPDRGSRASSGRDRKWPLLLGVVSVIALIVGGTLWTGGRDLLFVNLFQFPTRPGDPLQWGGHWRYHLLSHVMLMSVSFGVAGLVIPLTRGPSGRGSKLGLWIVGAGFAAFFGLTILFSLNLDPFVNAVFLGHQLREAFTHSLVSIPAAWGMCLLLARNAWGATSRQTVSVRTAQFVGAFGVVVGLFLAISGFAKSVASQGQSESLVVLLFPHFFEHTLSYFIVGTVAGLVYESTA
ncbi:MAG: hypothetical protein ACRD2N_25900 [Vicinamibacterales bacterium]